MKLLLRVCDERISFGCIKARHITGMDATIVLYENIRKCYTANYYPRRNDILLCDYLHSSVYIALALIIEEHLCLRALNLPGDVLREYFPLTVTLRYLRNYHLYQEIQ